MEKVVTINMSLNEFKDILKETIIDKVSNYQDLDPDEEMNQKQASKFLGISETTIIQWKKNGKIPYEQIPGSRKIRFYKSQLKKVVLQNPHLLQAARN